MKQKKNVTQKPVVEIPSDDGILLTYQQACKLLSIGRTLLSSLVLKGAVPCIRIGSSVRFRRSSLMAWVEQQEGRGIEA